MQVLSKICGILVNKTDSPWKQLSLVEHNIRFFSFLMVIYFCFLEAELLEKRTMTLNSEQSFFIYEMRLSCTTEINKINLDIKTNKIIQ